MTPSETLTKAADLIRDLAAKATDGPWTFDDSTVDVDGEVYEQGGHVVAIARYGTGAGDLAEQDGNGRWIAALSPALSPMIEKWLRETAADVDAYGEYWIDAPGHVRNALAFAKTILGSGVDTP